MAHFNDDNEIMKTLATILIFLMTATLAWGQADTVFIKYKKDELEEMLNYTTDTIIFDTQNTRQILYGTTVLPWTYNQQVAKGYGLYLDSISMVPCEQGLGKMSDMKNQVLSVSQEMDSLTIELKYWGNCCHSFLCDIEVKNDTIVNLIIHGYGATYCSCDCCYGLIYHLTTMKFDEFDKLKYVTINGAEWTKTELM